MPPRGIVFHIGLEKTGTTSFQRFCTRNRALLLGHGLLYPRPIPARGINHKLLAASYLDGQSKDRALALAVPPRARLLAAIGREAEASGAGRVLVSAEHLSSRFDARRVAALAADFAAFDPTILVAVRDPYARFLSSYASYVLGGGRARLPDYEAGLLADGGRYLSARQTLAPWEEVFGRERIRIVDYAAKPNLIAALLDACGVSDIEPDPALHRDLRSPRPDVLRVLQAVNRALAIRQASSPDESDAAWLQLMAFAAMLRKAGERAASGLDGRPLQASPHGRAAIAAIAAADQAWLAESYGLAVGPTWADREDERPDEDLRDTGPEDRIAATLVRRIPGGLWWLSEALVRASHRRPGHGRGAAPRS